MADQGLTITQAAEALGVSPKTIRRHIKEGKLPYVLVQGKFGDEYRIPLSPPDSGRKDAAGTKSGEGIAHADGVFTQGIPGEDKVTLDENTPEGSGQDESHAATWALDMINDLQKTNMQLAAQLGAAQERIRDLEGKVKLLTAGTEPWWKKLLRRLGAG